MAITASFLMLVFRPDICDANDFLTGNNMSVKCFFKAALRRGEGQGVRFSGQAVYNLNILDFLKVLVGTFHP